MGELEAKAKETPLCDLHLKEGARLVEFAGWVMPVQYSGIGVEHEAVRRSVGLFDISHMGQIRVQGGGSEAFLDYLLPAPICRLIDGQMLYTPLCSVSGKCIDDLVVYRFTEYDFLLVVNAARTEVDWNWISEQVRAFPDVVVADESAQTAMMAIQGPSAIDVLNSMAKSHSETLMGYYRFKPFEISGIPTLLSRNGYTGEDGFEIMCQWSDAQPLWNTLRKAGATPCGLGARDTLRTEMGYPLYGHELSQDITPLEAGIGWTLDLEKKVPFIGKKSLQLLKSSGQYRRLRGLAMIDRGIPRVGYTVVNSEGRIIGEISSGTQSPSLGQGIGLAFLERGYRSYGHEVFVRVRKKSLKARIVRLPFVESRIKKAL